MPKFYCVSRPGQRKTIESLRAACAERQVEFVLVNPSTFIPTTENLPESGDMVYRVSVVDHYGVSELEITLIAHGATSFYHHNDPRFANVVERDSYLLNNPQLEGVQVPKSFNYLPKDREALDVVVEQLGGFPIVVKVSGGSHGVGVMLTESQKSLYALADYLQATGERVVLKEYIEGGNESARLVVLGDEVIDSIAYIAPENDFRSNEGVTPNVKQQGYSKSNQQTAVAAVKALGLEFGGVDMLIDDEGKGYVVEVNLPNYYVRCEETTGSDISGQMLDYLMEKAARYL